MESTIKQIFADFEDNVNKFLNASKLNEFIVAHKDRNCNLKKCQWLEKFQINQFCLKLECNFHSYTFIALALSNL